MDGILGFIALFLVILLFFIGFSGAASNSKTITFSIEIPQVIVRNESGILYYKIGGFQSTSVPDMPKLPFRTYFFEIPFNAENITTRLKADSVSMGSVKNIGISKPAIISTSHTKTQTRTELGSSTAETTGRKFPKSIYSIGDIRHISRHRIIPVSVYPLQFDTSTNELKFYRNISIEISYDISNSNYGDVKATPFTEKIAEQIIYKYNSGNTTRRNLSGIKYVIITTPEISSVLEPLRDWKTRRGIPAGIYTTDWIYGRYNGSLNYVFHSGSGDGINNSMKTIIDLGNFTRANISFSAMFNIEYGWDFGYVEISLDGLNWKQLNGTFMKSYRDNKTYIGIPGAMAYTGNSTWIRGTIRLDDYAGNIIHLRFRYETDTYVSHGGWYLDNITINGDKGVILSDDGNNTLNWEFSGFEIIDINSRFNPAQKLIRDFIKEKVNNGAEFILLAGSDDKIPAMRVQREWYQELNDNDIVPTDYYYANLEGNWNTDNDEIYGENDDGDEITDWLPDVYVGRLPTSNKEDMEILVNKILRYEKNPNMTSRWFNRAVLAAGESDELTDEGYLKDLIKNNFLNGFNITRLYYLNNYEHEYPLDYSNTRNQLSIGQSIVNLAGHGSYTGIAQCETCPIFIDTNTNPANDYMLPLVYADSCDTGAFDKDNNLGRTAIMNWAIGFIGSTRTSYYVQDWQPESGVNQEMDYRFWEQFSNGNYRPAEALFKSKAWYVLNQLDNDEYPDAAKKNLLDYNLLGDPEIPIWTDVPRNFSVNLTKEMNTGKQNITITVRNSTGHAVKDAVVTIQKGSEIYDYKETDSQGRVEFGISPSTEGEINITITKHNFLPFESGIRVIQDDEPPVWISTTGIKSAKAGNKEVLLSWGNAYDPSGVGYNLYYSTTREWIPSYSNINLTELKNSEFDLLVLDPDELNSTDVEILKNSGKFVIGYIDIERANLSSYIDEIKSTGFQGVYIVNTDGENMIEFIKNISQIHRSYNFFIFRQGLGIASNISDYVDGFISENTYYSNTGNMTDAGITQEREIIMDNLLSKGNLILTLDYTENESETDFVYNRSLMRGYIPYVSRKESDKIIINKNHEPKPVAEYGMMIKNVTSPYTLRNLTNGMVYYFSVRAEDGLGNEDKNNVTLIAIPSAPLGCSLKGDKNCDDRIDDFELLDYINLWSKNLASDFDLLEVLNNWSKD